MPIWEYGEATERSPEELARLEQDVLAALREAVGERWVTMDPLILDTYAWQYLAEAASGGSYMERPLAVVLPASTGEVAAIVKACNRLGCQYKAFSTGFGPWNGATRPHQMVQIDLRRMDRIVEIDARNMYAVVEPYVTGNQLQTEAMKVGLNTHIVGAGGQCSVLASATSVMGNSWDGISTGYSGRNLLGVEWVTPAGEIVRLGSFEDDATPFTGDGPGFSLRGAIRGYAGAFGGLGVFTRCALKLYPWHGPARLEVSGASPEYLVEIPEHHAAGMIVVGNWQEMAEVGYRLCEAEILDLLGRNAPALVSALLTTDNNEFAEIYEIPLLHEMYYALTFIILGQDEEDLRYKRRTLKKIAREVGAGLLLSGGGLDKPYWVLRALRALARKAGWKAVLASLPGFWRHVLSRQVRRHGLARGLDRMSNTMYGAAIRSGDNMKAAFRYGGSFHTSMGALSSLDCAIRGAIAGEQIKKSFIERGTIFDDGCDNAWGGVYEGGCFAHLEELAMYDPRDPRCREELADFIIETNQACIEHRLGMPINAIGPPNHIAYSPACMNYDRWQREIKAALDPANASDPSFYTDPGFRPGPGFQAAMERVEKNRARIVFDD
jgi:glycolate oxidase